MPAPSVFKSAPFLYGTTGTVGAAGVAVTGWQFLGNGGSEYTKENTPFVGKFKSKPDASQLGLDANSTTAVIDKSYGCFSSFFYGATFPSNSESTLNSINSLIDVNPTTVSDKDKADPVGCMVMQLSYDLTDETNPKWVFKGEITIKSGNVGWALWLSGYGGKYEQKNTQYDQHMDYKLAFLEKKDESSWQIKTGLGWSGWVTTSNFSVRIADPNGKVWIDENVTKDDYEKFKGFKTDLKSNVYSYSGVWGVKEPGNEVFKDVNVARWQTGDEKLLRREGGFGSDIDVDYIYDGGSWKQLPTSPPPTKVSKDVLNKWYKPFKGKKGKWVDTDSYCKVYKNACTSQ